MSLNQFTNEYEGAVKSIASKLDTSFVKGTAVVVNNPMEYERTGVVSVKIPSNFCGRNMTVLDADGKEIDRNVGFMDKETLEESIHINFNIKKIEDNNQPQ